MKKFILTLITVLSLGLCFTSCTKGDDFVDEYIEHVEDTKASDEHVDTRNWLYVNTRIIDIHYKDLYLKEGIINNNDGTFSMVKEDLIKRDGSRNIKIDVIAVYSLQELKTFLYNDIINADFKGDTKGGIWRVTKVYINKITTVDYYHRFDKCDVNVSFTSYDNYNHYYTNTETVTFSSNVLNGISFTMNFNTLKDVVNKLYQF